MNRIAFLFLLAACPNTIYSLKYSNGLIRQPDKGWLQVKQDSVEPSPWVHEILNVNEIVATGSEVPQTKGSLAVFITGLLDRLLVASKIKNIVMAAGAQGYKVDLYFQVSKNHPENSSGSEVQQEHVDTSTQDVYDHEQDLRDVLKKVGNADLKVFNIMADQPEVIIPPNSPARMKEYPPQTHIDGQNAVRRFMYIETLYNESKKNQPYDFYLITRDDDNWLGPLDLDKFSNKPQASGAVFTRGCKTFSGVNDKTFLMGAKAGEVIAGSMITSFWDPVPAYSTKNVESFWAAFINHRLPGGSKPVPLGELPTAESAYWKGEDGHFSLCAKGEYYCGGLPQTPEFTQPQICPGTEKKHR